MNNTLKGLNKLHSVLNRQKVLEQHAQKSRTLIPLSISMDLGHWNNVREHIYKRAQEIGNHLKIDMSECEFTYHYVNYVYALHSSELITEFEISYIRSMLMEHLNE